ncbi:MAG: hypothetical protein KKA73_03395 [Chloroflexi bacterium]|nr:hypothetical protein [Chloroflexota bacterium]MBU1746709.1 hypothetical protein [Chloroflexota bacterium]
MTPTSINVAALWRGSFVVDDRTRQPRRVYLVDEGQRCNCGQADCAHVAAVRQLQADRLADCLDRVQAEYDPRRCPQCQKWQRYTLTSTLVQVDVCAACGWGSISYPQPSGHNGRPGRRARTAVRYL